MWKEGGNHTGEHGRPEAAKPEAKEGAMGKVRRWNKQGRNVDTKKKHFTQTKPPEEARAEKEEKKKSWTRELWGEERTKNEVRGQ